jgi:Ca2+-binding RTX toxin-like protein
MMTMLIIPVLFGISYTIDFITDQLEDDAREAAENYTDEDLNNGIHVDGTNADEVTPGTPQADRLFGAGGTDFLIGYEGDDRMFLGDGDDASAPLATGDDAGDDFIRGGAGDDFIVDTLGENTIHGDIENDLIVTIDGLKLDGTTDNGTPYAPDSIHGGYGEDTLVADAGDTITGGHDIDTFIIAAPSDDAHAPAIVTDFDATNETLSIVFLDEAPQDTTVSLEHDTVTGVTHALVEGEEVATLNGLTPEDLDQIQAYVTTLPDLIATAEEYANMAA